MKRKIICGVMCAVLVLAFSLVNAEEAPLESSTEAVPQSSDDFYTFRDIPWYTTKAEADDIFESEGAKIGTAAFKNDILRMSGINYISTSSGKDRVDGGGIIGRYSGLNVAGYDVSDTYAAYIYTFNDDGSINKTDDEAELYFGWYTFDSNDYVDGIGVYEDLQQKLESLYGEGQSDESSDYFTTATWYDAGNNQIRLLLGGKSNENYYVTLGYMVADADERLDEMQIALDNESAAQEALDREENADNTSGL